MAKANHVRTESAWVCVCVRVGGLTGNETDVIGWLLVVGLLKIRNLICITAIRHAYLRTDHTDLEIIGASLYKHTRTLLFMESIKTMRAFYG